MVISQAKSQQYTIIIHAVKQENSTPPKTQVPFREPVFYCVPGGRTF